ncbi:MAG: efflux RND transporter periplasmic adaptor subunit [Alphaproteobacteria bacterium]|nr:efflux RND transporter periplasmic adaptor subunit [Alphaproteobacteria bacterium]
MMNLWKITASWKLPILGLIGMGFALTSVLGQAEPSPRTPVTMPPLAPYENNVAGIGIIEPKSELISIGVELPGIVREIHVKVGDHVTKGQPLFSLDQRDIDARIAVLKAALTSAKVQLEGATEQFRLIESIKDNRAVAKDDYNRRKYAKELNQSRLEEIEAQLNQAKVEKTRLSITAPMDSTILDVNIRPGEFAAAGAQAEPLILMGDLSTLYVRVEFDEENAARLSQDAPATAYKRGEPSKKYSLSFVRFEPYVAPKKNLAIAGQRVDTRVLQVIYALPQNINLFAGQQMDVYVEEQSEDQ